MLEDQVKQCPRANLLVAQGERGGAAAANEHHVAAARHEVQLALVLGAAHGTPLVSIEADESLDRVCPDHALIGDRIPVRDHAQGADLERAFGIGHSRRIDHDRPHAQRRCHRHKHAPVAGDGVKPAKLRMRQRIDKLPRPQVQESRRLGRITVRQPELIA